jgi:hypothetical protein
MVTTQQIENRGELAPSPDGEGRGEENLNSKKLYFDSPHPTLSSRRGMLCFVLNSYNKCFETGRSSSALYK